MPTSPDQPEPIIPPRLAEAVRRHERSGGGGACGLADGRGLSGGLDLTGLDRAVLASAHRAFAPRRRSMIWRIGVPLAAAAGLAIAAWVAWPGARGAGPTSGGRLVFDAGKPVTILEAFQLARMLERGPGAGMDISTTWDVNGDGAIDQRDVDALAARAVRLNVAPPPRLGVRERPAQDRPTEGGSAELMLRGVGT